MKQTKYDLIFDIDLIHKYNKNQHKQCKCELFHRCTPLSLDDGDRLIWINSFMFLFNRFIYKHIEKSRQKVHSKTIILQYLTKSLQN